MNVYCKTANVFDVLPYKLDAWIWGLKIQYLTFCKIHIKTLQKKFWEQKIQFKQGKDVANTQEKNAKNNAPYMCESLGEHACDKQILYKIWDTKKVSFAWLHQRRTQKRDDKKLSKSFGVHCYSCSENTFQTSKRVLSSVLFRSIGPTLWENIIEDVNNK